MNAIEGDGPKPDEPRFRSEFREETTYGCELSANGFATHFHRSAFGWKGGGGQKLPETDFQRLDVLFAQLPDDGSRLPPAGRRLTVQVADKDQFRVRVYDRANAPQQVLEILRLSGSRIKSWLPAFQPASQWQAHEYNDGTLCWSPMQGQIISMSSRGPVKYWDLDTRTAVKEVAKPDYISATGIVLSPDGSVAVVEDGDEVYLLNTLTWRCFRTLSEPMIGRKPYVLSSPQFTRDGRFLLLESKRPGLVIFDTKTWQRRETIPGLPRDAVTYVPTAGTSRAIYLSGNGIIALWGR